MVTTVHIYTRRLLTHLVFPLVFLVVRKKKPERRAKNQANGKCCGRRFAFGLLRSGPKTAKTFTMSSSSSHSVPVVTGSRMQRWFPGTAHPLVVSAPMAFVTNPALVCEVVRAGGFGAYATFFSFFRLFLSCGLQGQGKGVLGG